MYKSINWIILRPMYFKENNSKGAKTDRRLYLMHEVKAKFFLKINAQKDNFKKFFDEIYSKPPRRNYKTKKK